MLEISYPKPDYHGRLDTEWSGEYGIIHKEVKEDLKEYHKIQLVQMIRGVGITDPEIENLDNNILIELLMSLHRRYNNRGYYELVKSEIAKKKYFRELEQNYRSNLLLNEMEVLNHIGSEMGYSQVAIAEQLGYSQQMVSKKVAGWYHPKIKLNCVIEYMTNKEIQEFRVSNWLVPQNGKTTGQRLTDKQLKNLKQLSYQGLDIQAIQNQTGISQQTITKYQKRWGL